MTYPQRICSIEYENSDCEPLEIYSAYLLDPAQVWDFSWGYAKEERKSLRKTWVLNGILSDEMLEAFRENNGIPVVGQTSILTTRAGATSLLVTTQFRRFQHRFMLPTFEPKVIDLLSGRTKEGLSLNFSNASSHDFGAFYRNSLQRADLLRLSSFTGELSREIRSAFVESLTQSVAELLESSPSLDASVPKSELKVEIGVLLTPGAARRYCEDEVLDFAQ